VGISRVPQAARNSADGLCILKHTAFCLTEMSLAEKNRERENTVRPKKRRPVTLGTRLDARSALQRACREGNTGTKAATSSARRGALAMIDVAACTMYHIARAHVNIGVVRHDGQNRAYHEPF
jgi:hypothetical protein